MDIFTFIGCDTLIMTQLQVIRTINNPLAHMRDVQLSLTEYDKRMTILLSGEIIFVKY